MYVCMYVCVEYTVLVCVCIFSVFIIMCVICTCMELEGTQGWSWRGPRGGVGGDPGVELEGTQGWSWRGPRGGVGGDPGVELES